MATEYVFLDGTVKWPKLNKPDQFGNFSLNLYPTEESLAKFQSLKLRNNIREDEDGKFITLRSPQQKLVKGRMTTFEPPEVVDADNKPLKDVIVGNGSEVTVKIVVYTFEFEGRKGKGSRMEKIRVNKLVPYERKPEEDFPTTPIGNSTMTAKVINGNEALPF